MAYPYSTATGTISVILSKIQSVGVPAKLDKKWLTSLGFKKDSEHRMISILKFLGFADEIGVPTDLWNQFRSPKLSKKVLGKAIKIAYSELYEIYPNAHALQSEELNHFFSTRTSAGRLALSHTVNTFKNLADYAEFEDTRVEPKDDQIKSKDDKKQATDKVGSPISQVISTNKDVSININIQLTVPETTNEEVYQKFFEAMKKHLLS